MAAEAFSIGQAKFIKKILKAMSSANAAIYKISKGRLWSNWAGKYPIMILSVYGAKTGKIRNVPLIKVMHDNKPVLVASM